MNIDVKWLGENHLEAGAQDDLEVAVREDLSFEANDRAKPCHDGTLHVELSVVGPLLDQIVGNVKCNCGKSYLKINGTATQSISYSRI
tara:strand:+ start:1986 stop:2249 length:264 start_codon:yes stop_codon:yes gene_type:complete